MKKRTTLVLAGAPIGRSSAAFVTLSLRALDAAALNDPPQKIFFGDFPFKKREELF